MDAVTLRPARDADAPAIAALTREAYARWVPIAGREPLPMSVDYAEAVRIHRFDLLEADGALVALIETTPEGEWLLIVNVAVRPACQGRGYGVRLLTHAEGLARAAGLIGARLYTNKLFEPNIRLYASLGYAVEREEAQAGRTIVHMVKPLA